VSQVIGPHTGTRITIESTAGGNQRGRPAALSSADCATAPTALEPVAMVQQQADALGLLAETALHNQLDPGASGERYQVVVHVDAPVLADPDQPGQSVLEDGARISAETSQRLACDASRVVMRHDEAGRLVEIGVRTRTIPPALRRALHHRDKGCRFPGCGVRFGQEHHIRHWARGGPGAAQALHAAIASPDPRPESEERRAAFHRVA
jgi:hypothetical protein